MTDLNYIEQCAFEEVRSELIDALAEEGKDPKYTPTLSRINNLLTHVNEDIIISNSKIRSVDLSGGDSNSQRSVLEYQIKISKRLKHIVEQALL